MPSFVGSALTLGLWVVPSKDLTYLAKYGRLMIALAKRPILLAFRSRKLRYNSGSATSLRVLQVRETPVSGQASPTNSRILIKTSIGSEVRGTMIDGSLARNEVQTTIREAFCGV
jgi:hypothetical protein